MMGQPQQKPNSEVQLDEDEREAAGYTNPDYPKNESYVPGSVHGSVRHMTDLARNALTLVSQFGCPHVFFTLTCNPKWPEILSQLLKGQTAFDQPDVTSMVFKS